MSVTKVWESRITCKTETINFGFGDIYRYRDLLFLFVKRDFIAFYKQTILGPLWFFIQPLLMTLTYVFIFGRVANLSSDGSSYLLFYLCGIITWTYFSDAVNQTSTTFTKNAQLFGKVYFPRIIAPLAVVITNLLKLSIQLCLFGFILVIYLVKGEQVEPNITILAYPLLVLVMGMLGLGIGLLVSSLTTKYRDLQFLIQFSVQLLMYASTLIFPLSSLEGKFRLIILCNPMSSIIETSRFMFLGTGSIPYYALLYTAVVSIVLFFFGIFVFNRTEKNFMDSV